MPHRRSICAAHTSSAIVSDSDAIVVVACVANCATPPLDAVADARGAYRGAGAHVGGDDAGNAVRMRRSRRGLHAVRRDVIDTPVRVLCVTGRDATKACMVGTVAYRHTDAALVAQVAHTLYYISCCPTQ